MDSSTKKRKPGENGGTIVATTERLTPEDAGKMIESFTHDQLRDIVQHAICRDSAVLSAVRLIADRDPAQRRLFIRGLGWDTTNETVRAVFSSYGDIEEAIVIADKATGKSKGFGFITFLHIDGALLALKEPSKKIDGRMTVTQIASTAAGAGQTSTAAVQTSASAADVALRKIYVGNVPPDMPPDRLLAHFSLYGEIEEGPIGFDKKTGKFRGFVLFVYKTVEAARASLMDPTKAIDGHYLVCKFANEGRKGKPSVPPDTGVQGQMVGGGANNPGDGLGSSLPVSMSSQYGGPGTGGLSSFGGFSGGGLAATTSFGNYHHLNSSLPSSIGLGTHGGRVPSSLGVSGTGGYGGGLGGSYGSSYGSSLQYHGPGSGGYGGLGMGSSLYQLPPSSVGMPSGGYSESGHYSMKTSAYPSQHHLLVASSPPGPRVPPGGGMYQSIPPYY